MIIALLVSAVSSAMKKCASRLHSFQRNKSLTLIHGLLYSWNIGKRLCFSRSEVTYEARELFSFKVSMIKPSYSGFIDREWVKVL